MYGERRSAYRILVRQLDERRSFEDPGVYRRIILKRVLEKWVPSTDWIDLAQGRTRWRAVENAVMNLRVA
jgi:hypothetical protein